MSEHLEEKGSRFVRNTTKVFILGITFFLLAVVLVFLVLSFFLFEGKSATTIRILLLVLFIPLSVLSVNICIFFSSLAVVDKKAQLIAQGNLNISNIVLDKTRGLENLTLALNEMKSNFLSFIELTKNNIVTLSDAIDQVSSSIDMNNKGNEQIAASMSNVAEKAQQQLLLVKDTITGVENTNSLITKITDSIKTIEEYIEGTVLITETGTRNLDLFYDQLNTMSDNLDNTNKFMHELNTKIGKISNIGVFIIQVSKQLKLLSLNATIEAARAGEAGKGFAVVSGEINELSSKTQESMKKIDEIVNEVMKSSETVNSSIGGFIQNFNESKEIFGQVKESFHSIKQQSDIINKDMKVIYKEINLIGTFTIETKEKGMELQGASDEISANTQDVAAVTEEVLAGLEGVTTQASALNTMLYNIQSLVKRFNTSVLPVEKVSTKPLKLACFSLCNNEFWDSIQRGVIYAQKELLHKNTTVDFYGYAGTEGMSLGDWMISKMKYCIEKGYDGISLPGFMSEMIPWVEAANNKNILVMAFNCDFSEKCSRRAIFEPNNYEAGKLAGKLIATAMGNSGNILIVRGGSEVSENRKKGMLEIADKLKKIRVVDDLIIHDVADSVYGTVKEYLESHEKVQGICVLGGGVEGAAKAIEEIGLINRLKLVGFEHTKEIYQYIQKGIIYASIGQDTFGQGHDPMIWLYNCIVTGEKTPSEIMYLRSDVVDGINVKDLFIV
ncbi:MAG: ABC-type sugar transport system, periplasmic component [Herbinix sp.]|jgi:methyl-accepting chemotaxis protein/ribose transport system substrate-binding protein|nr:ABC-type sugar transport system, periplasmic component [Herbinix sp.]